MKKTNIKRIISVVLVACMVLMMASCSSNQASIPDEYNYSDFSQYIKLAEYKGLEYTKITGDVAEDEVKNYIDNQLANSEESVEIKEGVVKEDSIVNIDYVGSVDGVEFEGGTAQNQELDIAHSHYIEGFAEGIVGHKVGETFDLHVTFPENYGNEELNGKPAIFKTTINALIEKKAAEYNDEWVSNNSEYKTVADYENSVKEQLSKEKLDSADANQKTDVFMKIVDGSEVTEYPEKELAARAEQVKKYYTDYATNSGMELNDFLTQMGMDAEGFDSMAEENAKNSVKQELVLHAIKQAEDLDIKAAGYNEYLKEMLEASGLTEESFKEQYGQTVAEYANENGMFSSYLYREVMNKVMEYAVGK